MNSKKIAQDLSIRHSDYALKPRKQYDIIHQKRKCVCFGYSVSHSTNRSTSHNTPSQRLYQEQLSLYVVKANLHT